MPTPVPPPDAAALVTSATNLVDTFGLMPLIFASAIVALGAFLLRRVRSAAR